MGGYIRPDNLDEVLSILENVDVSVMAGGTDFYPARVGKPVTETILDITGISSLKNISKARDGYVIGATATWTNVIEADLPDWFLCLKSAAREVGGVQIQNVGTVCGNICNASPAADGVPPLLALDARVSIASVAGRRSVPLHEFINGRRSTILAENEIVISVDVPRPRYRARSSYLKLGARTYLVISIAMIAVVLEFDDDQVVTAARIVVGACSEIAQRLPDLEKALIGAPMSPKTIDVVSSDQFRDLQPIDDIRGTAAYRRDAAMTGVRRCLSEALSFS